MLVRNTNPALIDSLGLAFQPLERKLAMKRSIGVLLLAVWLIITGLAPILHLSFSGMGTVMAILATATGVLLLLGM
jgi:hypothetical protein